MEYALIIIKFLHSLIIFWLHTDIFVLHFINLQDYLNKRTKTSFVDSSVSSAFIFTKDPKEIID
jgi:hypothetical protein